MTADPTPPRKKPAMTAAATHNNYVRAAEVRSEQATRRLATLANYVFGEGFLPEVAASAAGYKNRAAAHRAARHAGRPELAAALQRPTPAERRAAQIEDLEFLLDRGEWPERAVKRCGFTTLDSAINMIRRWGHNDLATRLKTLAARYAVDEEDAA